VIHLRAQNWSSLGDDTFWCWAEREFPGAVRADTQPVAAADHVLHYGLLGPPARDGARTVALLWEQHTEMQREVAKLARADYRAQIRKLNGAAAVCGRRTVASPLMVDDFSAHGPVDVLPIGVDTDLWRPAQHGFERAEIRERYNIPQDVRLGFWGGNAHPMKGWDLMVRYAKDHPATWWVIVFKRPRDQQKHGFRGVTVAGERQDRIAEMMRMCDFALFTSRLRPYVIFEWEAMSTNLPVVNVGHPDREFTPRPDPRSDVLDRGWDRHTAKATWLEYLS
jgi:glycosyltransferase involved in cell wall biosynthesis